MNRVENNINIVVKREYIGFPGVSDRVRLHIVTDNIQSVSNIIDEIKKLIYKWLNRRSPRKSFNWDKFNLFLKKYPLPRDGVNAINYLDLDSTFFMLQKGKNEIKFILMIEQNLLMNCWIINPGE